MTRTAATPKHTLDILEREIAGTTTAKKTGAGFLNVDTRVLEWLIADSRALADASKAEGRS